MIFFLVTEGLFYATYRYLPQAEQPKISRGTPDFTAAHA
jgi:hypothetical protein